MPSTWDLITTATSTSSSYTFTSIPSTYTDLVLVVSGTANDGYNKLTVNGDTGTNYYTNFMAASGSAPTSSQGTANHIYFPMPDWSDNVFCTNVVHFMNYKNTSTHKNVIGVVSDMVNSVFSMHGTWISTAAISSITITNNTNTFKTGTTFSLYGITAA
jgi:hypothetical protein